MDTPGPTGHKIALIMNTPGRKQDGYPFNGYPFFSFFGIISVGGGPPRALYRTGIRPQGERFRPLGERFRPLAENLSNYGHLWAYWPKIVLIMDFPWHTGPKILLIMDSPGHTGQKILLIMNPPGPIWPTRDDGMVVGP